MPDAWTKKDERMYEHIKKSVLKDGKTPKRAKEIAARTVNKQRRLDGKTPRSRSSGTGNPHSRLEDRTVVELRNRARELNIDGRSRMRKAELIRAIRSRND